MQVIVSTALVKGWFNMASVLFSLIFIITVASDDNVSYKPCVFCLKKLFWQFTHQLLHYRVDVGLHHVITSRNPSREDGEWAVLWRVSGSVWGWWKRTGGAARLWPRLLQELSGKVGGGQRQGGKLPLLPQLQDEPQEQLRAYSPARVCTPKPLGELQEVDGDYTGGVNICLDPSLISLFIWMSDLYFTFHRLQKLSSYILYYCM